MMVDGNLGELPIPHFYRNSRMDCKHVETGSDKRAVIEGELLITKQRHLTFTFKLTFDVINSNRIAWSVDVPEAHTDFTNFLEMRFKSPVDEAFYGMGIQYSKWNFKGTENIPLTTTEAGVGRGLQPLSDLKGIDAGSEVTTYASAASWITNKQRGFICTNTNFGLATFAEKETTLQYWEANHLEGFLTSGDDYMALAQEASLAVGTMKPLPEWLSKGMVVGIVGGQEHVQNVYEKLKSFDI